MRMDVDRHVVTVDGRPSQLPLKEFELLEMLLRNAGRVLTRMQLIDRVWGADYVGDTKTLDVHVALAVAVWQAISSFGYAPVTLLPPPGLVFSRLAQQLGTSTFQHEIASTLFRLFAGFSIAVILGVGIGLAAAASPAVNAVVRPIVRVLAPLPKVALYPALLLLLGFGHESKITLVAADALFPILLSTYYGASMVEQKLIWSAMAAGTPRRQILFKVVLPAAVPSILTGCRIGLVISCIVVFLAEMISSTDGLGHMLVTAARTFQAVDMFVPLITISLLGLILNGLLQGLQVLSAARLSGV